MVLAKEVILSIPLMKTHFLPKYFNSEALLSGVFSPGILAEERVEFILSV